MQTANQKRGKPRCMTVVAPGPEVAERVMAEVGSVGVLGIEERDESRGLVLDIHLEGFAEASLREVIEAFAAEGVRIESIVSVVEEDWSELWKAGLEAIVISDRLVVRPSFVPFVAGPEQRELIVDPGRAFGTGGHASTRLVLEWIDVLSMRADPRLAGSRVLDVGTGTGVLAMAALALGAHRAVGFDLDGVAVREASIWAERNALSDALMLFTGGIDALCAGLFDLVLANLLRTEVLPIADRIAGAVAEGGALILSGLLEADGPAVIEAFARCGLRLEGERASPDPSGGRWISPLLVRAR